MTEEQTTFSKATDFLDNKFSDEEYPRGGDVGAQVLIISSLETEIGGE